MKLDSSFINFNFTERIHYDFINSILDKIGHSKLKNTDSEKLDELFNRLEYLEGYLHQKYHKELYDYAIEEIVTRWAEGSTIVRSDLGRMTYGRDKK
jgi:glutathionyl-hydroquinone reductase